MKHEDHAFLAGKIILTIDDSPTISAFLTRLLSECGAIVDEVYNGREALALCGDRHYDLILLDLLLPDLDGLEVLQQIRDCDEDCAIVMLTGVGGIKTAIDAVRSGADGYVQKQDMGHSEYRQELFYVLAQALERRASLVLQRQIDSSRADFYAKITHDLRSPTSAILTSVELLLDEGYGDLTSEQRELLEIVQRMSSKVIDLVSNYLDLAKIEAGFLQIEHSRLDMRQLVENCIRLVGVELRQKEMALTLDLPPEPLHCQADSRRMQQVVDNLINNAIKYTGRGGRIHLQLCQDQNDVLLVLQDSGQGIPPEQLPGLFAKYHRVPSPNNNQVRGFGLGLFIVKEIVEAHGGTVMAESEGVPGRGSTFTVRLPLADEAAAPSAS